jgi:hypothetical protein
MSALIQNLDFLEKEFGDAARSMALDSRIVPVDLRLCWQLEATHPRLGSVFGSAPWIEALAETYGFKVRASALCRGDEVRSAILFAEIEDIRGPRTISLPFTDYIDPFVSSRAEWLRLVDPLMDRNVPLRLRCLRSDMARSDPRFEQRDAALWHVADLSADDDAMWARLQGSAQRNIRKARESGLVVREGRTLQDVATFYNLHFGVRKGKYRLFAQPFAFFENLHAAFSPEGRIITLLAEHDGVAVGGILFLIHGDTLYYKFNASSDLRFRPNDLLVWYGMQLGRRLGLARLDFGLSDVAQPGLIRFKQKFATDERPITELRWTPPGHSDARGQQAGRTLDRLTEILTDPNVPDDVTRSVGDEIYALFS